MTIVHYFSNKIIMPNISQVKVLSIKDLNILLSLYELLQISFNLYMA